MSAINRREGVKKEKTNPSLFYNLIRVIFFLFIAKVTNGEYLEKENRRLRNFCDYKLDVRYLWGTVSHQHNAATLVLVSLTAILSPSFDEVGRTDSEPSV